MFIGIIDFYHFIPLFVTCLYILIPFQTTFTFVEGHRCMRNRNNNNKNVSLHLDIDRLIFSNFVQWDYLTLHFDTISDDLDLHWRLQLYEKLKNCALTFSQISQLIMMKCNMLPQPVGSFKLMLNLFCTISIQGSELWIGDFFTIKF